LAEAESIVDTLQYMAPEQLQGKEPRRQKLFFLSKDSLISVDIEVKADVIVPGIRARFLKCRRLSGTATAISSRRMDSAFWSW
jgi:hypothetical protein